MIRRVLAFVMACSLALAVSPAFASHARTRRHRSHARSHTHSSTQSHAHSSGRHTHRARHGHHSASRSHASSARHHASRRAYVAQMNHAHDEHAVAPATRTAEGRLVLRLWSMNTHATCDLTPQREDGGFDDAAKAEFARVLSDPHTHAVHEIDPRLMDLVYQVAAHFNAPQVTVVSGFRESDHDSNHGHGRAVDFLLPGVSDRAVIEYALSTFQGVGVGRYPVSGFVHLDVRDRNYSWTDTSGPGQRPRYRHARRHHRHH